uniref:SET domain-containing protein n=1 Tax=Hyaloperonospora arabidopsidis (strain Emoy2) TaxID=559515 RepID=M4C340_HYAAE
MMDVVLLGRVFRRKDAEGLKPMELVWYEEDLKDQELILLAALAQKLNLVDADLYSMDEMLRMLSRFRNNNFSISDELLLPLGAGCFPLGAMINHSCDPNCAVTFVPETLDMEFRAMRLIKSGQEVTQTYVDVALPRRERQRRLQRKYHFRCNCARCAQSLQGGTSPDAFLDADIDGIPQEFWTQERQDEVEQALKEASNAASRGAGETDLAMQQQHRIEALEKLAERQGGILHRGNIAQLQTLSTLFSAEIKRGSVRAMCRYGERMLEFYRRVYSSNHPMTGLHLFTLGDLYDQMAQTGADPADRCDAKAVEYLAEAQRILRITHGKGHRLVTLLADRLDHRGRGNVEARSQRQ